MNKSDGLTPRTDFHSPFINIIFCRRKSFSVKMNRRSRAAYSIQSYTGYGVCRRSSWLKMGRPICSTAPLLLIRTEMVLPDDKVILVVTPSGALDICSSMPSTDAAWCRADVRYSLPAIPCGTIIKLMKKKQLTDLPAKV